MIVHFGLAGLQAGWQDACVCIGTFDGVHLGHQELIRRAVAAARAHDAPAVLVTFDRHPLATLRPEACPPALASLDCNLEQIAAHGIALTVVLAFDEALSLWTAERFLDEVLVGSLRTGRLVVGHDFAMGHGRTGTAGWLSGHLPTEIVEPVLLGEERVSSSAVRRAVTEGDVARARRLLGRPFELSGIVVGGEKLGRKLGYPTANLALTGNQVTPPDGVYAGRAQTVAGDYAAAISLGTRPTVDGECRAIEAYLLDYPGQPLYGTPLRLSLLARLRGQVRFDGVEQLVDQMGRDVDQTRGLLVNSALED